MGCHVITADNNPLNPGHRVASAFEIVSTVNEAGILDVARRHKVDGVLTYGSDVSVPAVSYVAEHLHLPGNDYHVAAQLQRKDEIRRMQRRLGLPHPRFVAASSATELASGARRDGVPFPALVKPADSSGSKGQSVALSESDFASAFEIALAFSRCGVVVAEEILPADVAELVCEAVIDDGRLVFAHYGHNWFCKYEHPRVPVGEIVPGAFGPDVVNELDRQIQALVSGAGVRGGCMNADALLSGGQVFLLDIGLRNGGYLLPEVVRLSSGVDLTAAAIHAALGIPSGIASLHAGNPRCVVSQVMHTHAHGHFASISVHPEIEPHIISTTLFVEPGDRVNDYTRGDAGIGMLIFEQPTPAAALELVSRIPHPCSVQLHPPDA
jgi:biotin carboxylase